MRNSFLKVGVIAVAVLPVFASAQSLASITSLVNQFADIVDIMLPVVVTLAMLFFVWGLAKFILAAGEEDAKEEGKRLMIWGGLALLVMVSIWGIIRFVNNLVGIDAGTAAPDVRVPGVEGSGAAGSAAGTGTTGNAGSAL